MHYCIYTHTYPPTQHSAIFQCLQGFPPGGLKKIILTASGGAFRDWPKEKLAEVRKRGEEYNISSHTYVTMITYILFFHVHCVLFIYATLYFLYIQAHYILSTLYSTYT